MDEPKRHIVEHYPAERLPEDLRGPISPDAHVTVTVDREDAIPMRRHKLQDYIGAGKGLYRSPEHVLQVLRQWRDEE